MLNLSRIKYAAALLLFVTSSITAMEWRSWANPPKADELYICIEFRRPSPVEARQIIVVRKYNPESPKYQSLENGWFTISKKTLWKLLMQGYAIEINPIEFDEQCEVCD